MINIYEPNLYIIYILAILKSSIVKREKKKLEPNIIGEVKVINTNHSKSHVHKLVRIVNFVKMFKNLH